MDSYNLFINVKTSFQFRKNARAVKSKKLQPAFKKFVREHRGVYNGVDLLRPIGKAFNPVSKRIVNRSTIYTIKGAVRTKFVQAFDTPVYDLVEKPLAQGDTNFNTNDYNAVLTHVGSGEFNDLLKALMKASVPHMSESSRFVITTQKLGDDGMMQDINWSHPFVTYQQVLDKLLELGKATEDELSSKAEGWYLYLKHLLEGQYESENWDLVNATITFQTNYVPKAGACTKLPKWLEGKNGIFHIINDDDTCGQRCLAVAMHGGFADLRKQGRGEKQIEKLSKMMCQKLSMNGRMSYLDFDVFATTFKKLVVILHDKSGQPIHTSEDSRSESKSENDIVYIFHDISIDHYHLVIKMDTFLSVPTRRVKWCVHCMKSYEARAFKIHKCKANKCRCCQSHEPHSQVKDWQKCGLCNAWCLNGECLEKHMETHTYKKSGKFGKKGETKKVQSWKCGECKKWIDFGHFMSGKHVCGEEKCRNCGEYHCNGDQHRCNIIKPKTTKDGENHKYIAFDFESKFKDGYHIVNYANSKSLYTHEPFHHTNVGDFIQFALSHKNTTFIAHNLKGYDGWLIHNHLVRGTGIKPDKITLAGQKIMYMKFGSVRFIDSLNFITTSLSEMPKMFGLDTTEFKKGYFPYLMNTDKYADYVGPMPTI